MFMGSYKHKLDKRDRLSVPARIRDTFNALSDRSPILTAGFDKSLFLIPFERWQSLSENSEALATTRESARMLERFLFAYAQECPFDSQGRILIPENLKRLARLEDEAVVVGVRNRVEIWSGRDWDEQQERILKQANTVAEQAESFSI